MLNLKLYLVPFFVSFSSSILFIVIINYFSSRFFKEKNNLRKEKRHLRNKVSRMGGVAIFLAFMVAIIWDNNLIITKDIWGILAGSVVMVLGGFWDDIREINWKKQVLFQIVAISCIFIFGARINFISNPWGEAFYLDTFWGIILGIAIGVLWSMLVMNSMNWIDGIDGLSAGIFFIVTVAIFLLALKPEVNQPPVSIIAIALAGSILGFLIFNFPPAKIMAGSSGVFFIGFIIASLSIFAGTKIATTLLILFIPAIDFFWVIIRRLKAGKSIFLADREHLHHKLLDLGWSQKNINLLFYFITTLVALVALNIRGLGKIIIILFLALGMFIFYGFIGKFKKIL